MTLYHFTPQRFIHSVLREGLTKGGVPLSLDPPKLDHRFRWLTQNESFQQAWSRVHLFDYDRTAYRITIEIPRFARSKLSRWTQVGPKIGGERMYHDINALNDRTDPENWFLFKGTVRRQWFRAVDAKEGVPEITDAVTS